MANFTGFSEAQVEILKADLEAARQIAASAARIGPQTSTLLHEAFAIDPAAPDPSQVNQVKNVYAGFAARMATAALVSYPGIGDAYDPEFDSFPDRTRPNTILVRYVLLLQGAVRPGPHAAASLRAPAVSAQSGRWASRRQHAVVRARKPADRV